MAALGVAMVAGAILALLQIGWIWLLALALEVALPKSGQISFGRRLKGLTLGVVYWCAAGASGPIIGFLLQRLGVHPQFVLHVTRASLVGWIGWTLAGTLVGLLSFEFLYYWWHRLQHKVPFLWRFHAVHHAIEDIDAVNAYPHWTEELSRLPIVAIPTALLVPVGLPALPWQAWSAFHSVYIHTQTKLNFGPFWRLCMDNRFHRLHHSVEERHFDKNFGLTTPLWDWLFGTLYVPAKDEWPDTGLAEAPEIDGLGDFLWRPFRRPRWQAKQGGTPLPAVGPVG